jgi:hypothetical protein
MNARTNHWTDEDLLLRLYGTEAGPRLSLAHFDECAECAARWTRLEGARAGVVAAAASVPCADEVLRAQRLAVFSRIERPARRGILRVVPAAATCFVVILAVALNRPAPQPAGPQIASAVSDEQLFADIANVVDTDAPRAVEPIRGLFSEASNLEVQ